MLVARRTWFQHLVTVRGSVFQRIWPRLFLTVSVAALVTLLHERWGWFDVSLTTLPFTLIGVPLGIFLGFRNNTAYDRFWEGRKLWGHLVNTTRTFTRQVLCLVGPMPGAPPLSREDEGELRALHRELVHTTVAFVHALRHHLRDTDPFSDLHGILPRDLVERLGPELNRPIAILHHLGERLRDAWQRGWIHDHHMPAFEGTLCALTDIQGGCERIKSTPIPASYTVLIHRIVAFYSFALPFGIVDSAGPWTPIVVLLIGHAFYGLDAIGDEIENPFGFDENDLPLATLSRMIEVNLRQRLGETALPPLLVPRDGVAL